jgi:CheY-like chemotaxis protein
MTTAALSATNPVQMEAANFLNLLIVDDERAIREVCREVAQSLGFNTAVADSAEHAYRLLDTQNIDVVLLDLKLPGAGDWRRCIRSANADPMLSSWWSPDTARCNPRCRP